MKKKSIFSTILTIMICVFMMSSSVLASGLLPNGGKITAEAPNGGESIANNILGVIQYISFGIAIGMLMYVGIKYMLSPANEKADLKNGAIRYVIGAIIIFSTGLFAKIWSMISSSFEN